LLNALATSLEPAVSFAFISSDLCTKKTRQQDVFLGLKTQSSVFQQETAEFCFKKDNIDLLGSNIDETV